MPGRGHRVLVEHVAKSEWVHTKPCCVCSCSTTHRSHPQISLLSSTSSHDAVGHGKINTVREALLFTPWALLSFKGRDWMNYPWAQTNRLPLWQARAEVRPLHINTLDFKDQCWILKTSDSGIWCKTGAALVLMRSSLQCSWKMQAVLSGKIQKSLRQN